MSDEEGEPASQVAQPSVLIPPDTTTTVYDSGSRTQDLDGHVLLKWTGPAARNFEEYGDDVWTSSDIAGTFGIDLGALYEAGFVDAYGTAWLNDWGSDHGQDLISVTMVFDTKAGAAEIYKQMRDSDEIAGMTALPDPKLGDGSYAWRGMYGGAPTVAYAWFSGDEVAIIASQGSDKTPAVAPVVVRSLAKGVQLAIAWNL